MPGILRQQIPFVDDEEVAPDGRIRRSSGPYRTPVETPIGQMFDRDDVMRVEITRSNGNVRTFWRVCDLCLTPMDRHDQDVHDRYAAEIVEDPGCCIHPDGIRRGCDGCNAKMAAGRS